MRIELDADVVAGGDCWRAVAEDFGVGGCRLRTRKPLPPNTSLRLLLRSSRRPESLLAEGTVAWQHGDQAGIRFLPEYREPAGTWLLGLARRSEGLKLELARQARRVEQTDVLVLGTAGSEALWQRPADELVLLHAFHDGCTVEELASRVSVPPLRFAQALFGLVNAGCLAIASAAPPRPPVPVA